MKLDDALRLAKKFPRDKTVPKQISEAISNSRGEQRDKLLQIGEGLIVQAVTREDKMLVMKHLMT